MSGGIPDIEEWMQKMLSRWGLGYTQGSSHSTLKEVAAFLIYFNVFHTVKTVIEVVNCYYFLMLKILWRESHKLSCLFCLAQKVGQGYILMRPDFLCSTKLILKSYFMIYNSSILQNTPAFKGHNLPGIHLEENQDCNFVLWLDYWCVRGQQTSLSLS